MTKNYHDAVETLYSEAAAVPNSALCCTQAAPWKLPGLTIPQLMLDRNYGCGSTISPRDLSHNSRVLYVGVGAGMEALQLSYFVRRSGGVVAIDKLQDMLDIADEGLKAAAQINPWFDPSFVALKKGDALSLPVETGSVDVAAQNCLFNIFSQDDLAIALKEMHRVLKPGGTLLLSDPIATRPIPPHLAADDRLRAECLSGALPLQVYLDAIVKAGFGTIEIRSKRPYRVLDKRRHGLESNLLLESVEVAAYRDEVPDDGPCIFTGKTAIYVGEESHFDDNQGHLLTRDIPMGVCDKTAKALASLGREDLVLTGSTWHYAGDGCC